MYAHIYLAGALMAGLEKRCPGLDLEVDRMGTHCHVGHVDSVVESEECCAPRMKPTWGLMAWEPIVTWVMWTVRSSLRSVGASMRSDARLG